MFRTRIIPTLLLKDGGLVKGKNFKNHKYVGDPINAVKIFNEKEVDELFFFDISTGKKQQSINFNLIADIASEAFMPLGYGGGIKDIYQIEQLFKIGVEKVAINTAAFFDQNFIKDAVKVVGSQSIVISIDVRKTFLGKYEVYVNNGQENTKLDPVVYAKKMEDCGAGELIVCSIDREGTHKGYDLKLLELVSKAVDIPVIGLGGASSLLNMVEAKNKTSVSGLAAGNLFIYYGKHRAVLMTYPKYNELKKLFN
ncbi:AglZ/HisF2 family acetamidino modification protein [Candidatus Pelagibacter sp.]|nr:AglZ/HisF2 family acetamidino modification protein [Candidatus Pelagibacter sp.]